MPFQILKYPVGINDEIKIHQDAEILDMQFQGEQLCVWAIADIEKPEKTEQLIRMGTGWNMPSYAGDYISTIQNGRFVWHYFLNCNSNLKVKK